MRSLDRFCPRGGFRGDGKEFAVLLNRQHPRCFVRARSDSVGLVVSTIRLPAQRLPCLRAMNWLATLENTGLATWLRESGSIWAYPIVLTLHTAGMGVLVGANWALDLRLLGVAPSVPLAPLERLFSAMWAGFWVNAVTGVLLFMADATTKGSTSLFIVKLVIVAAAVAVAGLTRRYVYRPAPVHVVPMPAQVLAGLSIVLWLAAITAGRLMAYV